MLPPMEGYVFKLDFSVAMTFAVIFLLVCAAFSAVAKGFRDSLEFGIQAFKLKKYGL